MAISLEGTIIGLDVGSKRIGVARVNTFAKLPEALELIDVAHQEPLQAIKGVVLEYDAVAVVVGLPRGLDGQETAQTAYCREFADNVKKSLEIPVYMIDEAGTSKEADNRLEDGSSISRDSMAAAIILEDFIAQTNIEELLV